MAYHVAQLPSFNELLDTVSGRKILVPSYYRLSNELDSQCAKMKSTLKELLSKQKYLCCTADVWTSRAQSYLGVTVHFLNNAYKRESYVLAFKEMKYQQTYKELGQTLHDIFADYGFKITKITNIVTDGCSSFCKMFKVFGVPLDSTSVANSSHVDDVENGSAENQNEHANSVEIVVPFMEDANGELLSSEILNFNNECPDADVLIDDLADETPAEPSNDYLMENNAERTEETKIELPPQQRCVSHVLNLLSHDFDKRLTDRAKKILCAAIVKLNSLWVLTHRSSRAKSMCKDILGKCSKVPVITRWNSKYDAVRICVDPDTQPKINTLIEACSSMSRNLEKLTDDDFYVLTQYVKVLDPVAKSLDKLQGQHNCSQGFIIPVLFSMKHRLNALSDASQLARDLK